MSRRSQRIGALNTINYNEEEIWKFCDEDIQREAQEHQQKKLRNSRKNDDSSNHNNSNANHQQHERYNDASSGNIDEKMDDDNNHNNAADIFDQIRQHTDFLISRVAAHFHIERDEATKLVSEIRKFLYLKIKAGDYDAKILSPSAPIDDIWHLYLKYPKRYYKMCLAVGNDIIDHNPDGKWNECAQKRRLQTTMKMYHEHFGEPPKEIWGSNDRKQIPKIAARKSAPATGGVEKSKRGRPC